MGEKTRNEAITREEILLTAELSQLPLTEAEIPQVTKALGTILEHFSAFSAQKIDHAELHNPVENRCSLTACRADTAVNGNRERVAEIAPDFEDAFFFVPRIK